MLTPIPTLIDALSTLCPDSDNLTAFAQESFLSQLSLTSTPKYNFP